MKNNNKKLGKETAFPSQGYAVEHYNGMSKRFYAACAAMQGLCVGRKTSEMFKCECVDIAERAFVIADELLKQENE